MKFRPYEQNQIMLLPPNIEEMIPANHLVRGIDLVVEELNLSKLYSSYSEEGQPGYHPKLLLKILLYGYSTGVRSSRKLAEKAESDVYYMYLTAMQRPDFRTISDFRKNRQEYFTECFIQVVEICRNMGMISLGHISIDGSKIKSCASKTNLHDKEELEKILEEAERIDEEEDRKYGKDKRGDELPEELTGREKLIKKIKQAKEQIKSSQSKRVNIEEPESRIMRLSDGRLESGYNAQIAVDSDKQIIVANDVVNEEYDNKQFIPMYEKAAANTKKKPLEVSADAGYYSGKNYLYLEKNNIDGYIPNSTFTKEAGQEIPKYDRRRFVYDEKENKYICPEGKEMKLYSNNQRNGVKFKTYKGKDCKNCTKRQECLSTPNSRERQILIYENDQFKEEMKAKLLSTEGHWKMRKRMATVEPVFAHLKEILGFRRFSLKGLEKSKFEFTLLCTAYNIKKLTTAGKLC